MKENYTPPRLDSIECAKHTFLAGMEAALHEITYY